MLPATKALRPASAKVGVGKNRSPAIKKPANPPHPFARATERAAFGWAATLGCSEAVPASALVFFLPFFFSGVFSAAMALAGVDFAPSLGALDVEDEAHHAPAVGVAQDAERDRAPALHVAAHDRPHSLDRGAARGECELELDV